MAVRQLAAITSAVSLLALAGQPEASSICFLWRVRGPSWAFLLLAKVGLGEGMLEVSCFQQSL